MSYSSTPISHTAVPKPPAQNSGMAASAVKHQLSSLFQCRGRNCSASRCERGAWSRCYILVYLVLVMLPACDIQLNGIACYLLSSRYSVGYLDVPQSDLIGGILGGKR